MLSMMVTTLQRQLKASRQHLKMLASSPSMQSPDVYLQQRSKNLELLQEKLYALQNQIIHLGRQRFLSSAAKLDALSPLKVLTRGYAMVQTEDGNVLRSIKNIAVGEQINVIFGDGSVTTSVTNIKEKTL